MPVRNKIRLDEALVLRGVVRSRSQAQDIIKRGLVASAEGAVIKKPSHPIFADEISQFIIQPFNEISRAGDKLAIALSDLNLEVRGLNVLDLGQSTGGFTNVLLEAGVNSVVGVEVGIDQLDSRLKTLAIEQPSRLTVFEKLNCKDLDRTPQFIKASIQKYDLIVADLSFISLTKALPVPIKFLKEGGLLLVLFKPQFELTAKSLNKNGIVRHIDEANRARANFEEFMQGLGLSKVAQSLAGLKGKDGNQEFFILFKNKS